MIFGQLVKDILVKNNKVFIPEIGTIMYREGSSQIIVDHGTQGSTDPLISAITEKGNVGPLEAQTILSNFVSDIKSSLKSNGKYQLEGIGDLIDFNNGFQIMEEKKTLFPSDFFGMSNFDLGQNDQEYDFYANVSKESIPEVTIPKVEPQSITPSIIEEYIPPVKDELAEEVMAPVIEVKPIIIETPPTIIDPVVEALEVIPPNAIEASDDPMPLEEKVKKTAKVKEEPIEIEEKPTKKPKATKKTKDDKTIVEKIEEKVDSFKEETSDTFAALKADLLSDNEEDLDIEEEDDDFTPIETNANIEKEWIDPSSLARRNIGRSDYDQGFYDHLVNADSKSSKLRLGRVLPIILGLAVFGFMATWVAATMQNKLFLGMNPLWETKKSDLAKPVKQAPIVQAIDSVNRKDSNSVIKADSVKKNELLPIDPKTKAAIAEPIKTIDKPAPGTKPQSTKIGEKQVPPTKLKAETVAKGSTVLDKKATLPKPQNSKTAESKTKDLKKDSTAKSNLKTLKVKDTSSKKQAAKGIAIVGKPFATANYTKGNHYLSLGNFKIPKNAQMLKMELKKRAGVETDIINVDGTYRVVIPYTNKSKAVEATKDFPNSSIFE
jgi:hypothetical protein